MSKRVIIIGSGINSLCAAVVLAHINPNLVGGDPYCGTASLDQFLFWRPLPDSRGHNTPVRNSTTSALPPILGPD